MPNIGFTGLTSIDMRPILCSIIGRHDKTIKACDNDISRVYRGKDDNNNILNIIDLPKNIKILPSESAILDIIFWITDINTAFNADDEIDYFKSIQKNHPNIKIGIILTNSTKSIHDTNIRTRANYVADLFKEINFILLFNPIGRCCFNPKSSQELKIMTSIYRPTIHNTGFDITDIL